MLRRLAVGVGQRVLAFHRSPSEVPANMVSRRDIRRVCSQIAREFKPQRIVLFGSYAYGRPTPDSDVDLLIVMPFEGRPADQAVRISNRLDHSFPIDLLVHTPQEVRQRLEWDDVVLREITNKGEVLYESGDAGVGGQG